MAITLSIASFRVCIPHWDRCTIGENLVFRLWLCGRENPTLSHILSLTHLAVAVWLRRPWLPSSELFYDPIPLMHWMQQNTWVPVLACTLYVVGIVAGQAYFKNHDRWNWRYSMAAWNLFLAVFSFMGMVRTAPHLFHNLLSLSVRDNLCSDPRVTYGSGSTGLWTQFFVWSKFPYVSLLCSWHWVLPVVNLTSYVPAFVWQFLSSTANSLTPTSLSSTSDPSSSCTGTTTSRCCCTAGIPTSWECPRAFSSWSWTTPCTLLCTFTIS